MEDKQKNFFITEFLRLRKLLKERRNLFISEYDTKNPLSKLSGVVEIFKNNKLLSEEESNKMIQEVKENSCDADKTLNIISEKIEEKLIELGYTEKENNQTLKKEHIEENVNNSNENLVEQYTKIIDSIEKMINEIDKTMKEVDAWINKIGVVLNNASIRSFEKEEKNSDIENQENQENLVNLVNLN